MCEPLRILGDQAELAVAIHEAGHAVAHYGLGDRIRAASIDQECRETGDPLGFVLIEPPGPSSATISMIATAAGPAAAFRLFGVSFRLGEPELAACMRATGGDANELARTSAWLERKHSGTEACRHLAHALALAEDLLSRPLVWRAVMDLAALLIRRRAEYGPEIHENIERHIAFGSLATPDLELTYDEIARKYGC